MEGSPASVTLLHGGLVWSGLSFPLDMVMRNECIAVSGGIVLSIGSNWSLRRQYPDADLIDLRGRSVVPYLRATNHADNPWIAVWARLSEGGGKPIEGLPLTRAQALSELTEGTALTVNGLRRGRLDPGWASNLVVLSADYFTIDERDIPKLHAELTLVGERISGASLTPVSRTG